MQLTNPIEWYDTPTLKPALILAAPACSTDLWRRPLPSLLDELEARLSGVTIGWADPGRDASLRTAIAAARFHGASRAVLVSIWGSRRRLGPAPQLPGIETGWTEAPPEVEAILSAYHNAVMGEACELPVAV